MVRWLELTAEVDRESVEPVSTVFSAAGGAVILDEAITPTSDWGGWEADPNRPVRLRTYLPCVRGVVAKRKRIERALWHLAQLRPMPPLQVREVDEHEWAEAWKQHFVAHRVGQRIVIRPSWREYTPAPDDVVIDLDPGMAFGTGLHPTTRLCLAALERVVRPGDEVLDLGTGSGILAIAAAKLGAERVLAIDTDPVAVDAATSNVAANGLADRVTVIEGTVEAAAPAAFDVVAANISAKVLIAIAPELARVTRPGGRLLASGLLDDREIEVALALAAAGFHLAGSSGENDWRLLDAVRDTVAHNASAGGRSTG
ncbi:MAG: ribosomal protein L11 methyltransferase [Dehalococcoidia bacterium]|jgi:ribosomal protein L11 methyltransferase|nr:MAG: ribosomal protein L11 methyltransferase [Dehalococcoidia bacterium]